MRGGAVEWGVRFTDGSVRHPWNGRTARLRAEEELERLRREYPNESRDNLSLVFRENRKTQWMEEESLRLGTPEYYEELASASDEGYEQYRRDMEVAERLMLGCAARSREYRAKARVLREKRG
jgi:hypothetical protein